MKPLLIVFSRGKENARIDFLKKQGGHHSVTVEVPKTIQKLIESELNTRFNYSAKNNLLYGVEHENFKHHDGKSIRLFKNDELAELINTEILQTTNFQINMQ